MIDGLGSEVLEKPSKPSFVHVHTLQHWEEHSTGAKTRKVLPNLQCSTWSLDLS